jgi:isopropylmalate/homocitrate/citramalate synthase
MSTEYPPEDAIETTPFNYHESFFEQLDFPDEVRLADTTLRDGEQTPGVVFSPSDKLAIARRLDEIGVSRIEAGNPRISEEERAAIAAIAEEKLSADIFVLARAEKEEIDRAVDLGVDGVYVFPKEDEFDLSETDYETHGFDSAFAASRYAIDQGLDVTFYGFDVGRTSLEWIEHFFGRINEDIVSTVSLVDQVGIANPLAVQFIVEKMVSESSVPVEAHLHNDFGLATANSLMAAAAGAEVIDVTMNGIGERCGNPALEEVASGLKHLFGQDPVIDLTEMRSLATEVERRSNFPLSPNKPLTGDDIFRFSSGMIISGIRQNPDDFLPYDPAIFGQSAAYEVGKHSERPSFEVMLEQRGVDPSELSDEDYADLLERVQSRSQPQQRPLENHEFYDMVRDVRPDLDI